MYQRITFFSSSTSLVCSSMPQYISLSQGENQNTHPCHICQGWGNADPMILIYQMTITEQWSTAPTEEQKPTDCADFHAHNYDYACHNANIQRKYATTSVFLRSFGSGADSFDK